MGKTLCRVVIATLSALSFIAIQPSCTHEPDDLSLFDTVCFQQEILPVFRNGCATTGCHSGSGEGFALNNYDEIVKHVQAGSPSGSQVYQAITASLLQPMPPGNPLAESDRIRIRIWIEQGAKNTTCETGANLNPTVKGVVR